MEGHILIFFLPLLLSIVGKVIGHVYRWHEPWAVSARLTKKKHNSHCCVSVWKRWDGNGSCSMSVIESKEGLVNAGRDHLAGAK